MKRDFIILLTSLMLIGLLGTASMSLGAGTWTQKADMPTARYWSGSAVVDGKIYVFGGMVIGGWSSGCIAVVEEYDPAADTWTRRADMPTARGGLGAAVVDGIIYAVGGWDGRRAFSTVEAYDPATGKWTTKADMPTARDSFAIAVVDGNIYVIGGIFAVKPAEELSAVEVYDPATDKWTTKADMPTARYGVTACVIDGRIYAFGGNTKLGDPGLVPLVEVYDPTTDTWTQASDMPWSRNHHTASVVDGKMYIFGGCTGTPGDGEFMSPVVDVYDPATDTCTTAADFPTPRWDLTAAVVDGKIYTIGGSVGEWDEYPKLSPVSTVEEFDPGLPGVIQSVSPGGKLLETWGGVKSQ